ncbi:hypothetical protein CBL_14196 [Carabus blaptoides fortunei]
MLYANEEIEHVPSLQLRRQKKSSCLQVALAPYPSCIVSKNSPPITATRLPTSSTFRHARPYAYSYIFILVTKKDDITRSDGYSLTFGLRLGSAQGCYRIETMLRQLMRAAVHTKYTYNCHMTTDPYPIM